MTIEMVFHRPAFDVFDFTYGRDDVERGLLHAVGERLPPA